MGREEFLEVLKKQYADEIQEIYIECEHQGTDEIDYLELDRRLKKLMKAAQSSGLPPAEFEILVRNLIPDAATHGAARRTA